jgi:hypothetical protein
LLRIDEIAGKTPGRALAAIQNAYYTEPTRSSRGERVRRIIFGRSDGQTLVEFALVLPIFLLIVMGVFELGRAITYWHDLNNTAQVAARYAVVNRYPDCPGTCIGFLAWAKSDLNSGGLRNDASTSVAACYRDDDSSNTPTAGDPVTVTMTSTFKPAKFLKLANLTLRGKATLRLEQNNPTNIGLTPCP